MKQTSLFHFHYIRPSKYLNLKRLPNISVGWLWTIGVFLLLLLPYWVQKGMFFDGVTYASISRNLAFGSGSFWEPHYTDGLYSVFHEQPPLALYLNSLLFQLFGDYWIVERIFSMLIGLFCIVLIALIWNGIEKGKDHVHKSWLPVLLWVVIPIVNWSFRNNMLENVMSLFTLLSIYLLVKSIYAKNAVLYIALSSLSIIAGVLTKGPVALFPLAFFFFYGIIFRKMKFSKVMVKTSMLIAFVCGFIGLIFVLFENAQESLMSFYDRQLLGSILGDNTPNKDGRWFILRRLLEETYPYLILLIASILISRSKGKFEIKTNYVKWGNVFLFIGLSASVPIAISLKQSDYYLVPSLPYFALSISCYITSFLPKERFDFGLAKFKFVLPVLLIFCAILISFNRLGTYNRDSQVLKDIIEIKKIIPEGEVIKVERLLWENWTYVAYFQREGRYSFVENPKKSRFFLKLKSPVDQLKNGYKKISINLKTLDLFKKE